MYRVTHCQQNAASQVFGYMGESMKVPESILNLSSPYLISEKITMLNFLAEKSGDRAMMICTIRRRLMYM